MTVHTRTQQAADLPGATTLPVATARATLRTVTRAVGPRRGSLIVATLLMVVGTVAALAVPPLLGVMIDAVARSDGRHVIALAGIGLVASGGVAAVLSWFGGVLLVRSMQGALAELREEAFAEAVTSDLSALERAGSSDVVSRVTSDVEAVTEAVTSVVPRMLGALLTIALTAVGLFVLDPLLALAALPAVPVQVWTTRRFLRRSRPLYARLHAEEAVRGQDVIESVSGASTVRAHRWQDRRLGGIAAASEVVIATQCAATRVRNRFNGGLNIAEFIGLAGVLIVGFTQVGAGALTIGAATAGALFIHRLFGPIGSLLGGIDEVQRAAAGLERIVGLIDSGLAEPGERREIDGARVLLTGVDFEYTPGLRALIDVDLEVPEGSKAVLVGRSGSGKSTTGRLIGGLSEPTSGSVLIGGVPASRATAAGRPAVLLVTQETHVFSGTVADNLRLADPEADDAALAAAGTAVGIAERLLAVPMTDLDDADDDALLQRIALARVLLADPPVVVLDEATAHGGGDGALDEALAAVTRGRTSIVIAHRLAQAVDADQVVVFEHGRIAQRGTVNALRGESGPFADLWRAWSGLDENLGS